MRWSSVMVSGGTDEGSTPRRWTPDRLLAACFGSCFTLYRVPMFRITEAAELLGVSDDTVRRWLNSGQLPVERDQSRRMVIDGVALAAFARDHARPAPDPMFQVGRSARNRFVGLVTNVIADTVMTQIEIQCGPHRVVSLISTEAARELGLSPGSLAVAVVKSTQVIIETPNNPHTLPAEDY
jgi:molybdopterin-binding protein